ncbi:hypothetical protein KJ596_04540 [Patescibacteria group bacterium]|nr:hypothetical protein [Patescibacteria group bacterium]MBU1868574.1 hypothetical protein [Patescibacteria group bacterium]
MREQLSPEAHAAAIVEELVRTVNGSDEFAGTFSNSETRDTYIVVSSVAPGKADIQPAELEAKAKELGINTFIEIPAVKGEEVTKTGLPVRHPESYYNVYVVNPFDTPEEAAARAETALEDLQARFKKATGNDLLV